MIIRARFFGKDDGGNGFSLNRAKDVIESFDINKPSNEINDILEYYNITRLYDAGLFSLYFSPEALQQYAHVIKLFRGSIGRFYDQLKPDELPNLYDKTETLLKGSFFPALSSYKAYIKIADDQFDSFLGSHPAALSLVVRVKDLVIKYGNAIRKRLLDKPSYAELIINHYFVQGSKAALETFMPSSFSQDDIEQILSRYIDWDDANPNYLHVISGLKKTGSFLVSDKLRLKAQKKYDAYWEAHRAGGNQGFVFGFDVIITNQPETIKNDRTENGHIERFYYSREWIEGNLDYPTLLNNFIYLFDFTDRCFRCSFISNPANLGITESRLGIHGTNEYPVGIVYHASRIRTSVQLNSYQAELAKHNISIESLFKWFFEEYLKQEFGAQNFCYITPSAQASCLEKILLIASQLDAVTKQFRMYVEDGQVDRELYEFSSAIYRIIDVPSMFDNKYVYSSSADIDNAMFMLFSEQCLLAYTEKTKETYRSFAELITNERIKTTDYPDYEQPPLNWLLDHGIINVDDDGYLFTDTYLLRILSDLNFNGSIAYLHYDQRSREVIDNMISNGELTGEKSLFTRQEQDYLDYMLNVHQFINGPDIRNKYVHGNFPLDVSQQQKDYLELLKIMIVIVIKINEEFCIKNPLKDNAGNNEE